jgi:hypothetical protein
MKKLLYQIKIRLGIALFSILQNPYCFNIFRVLYFIWALPSALFFLFVWLFKFIMNLKYILNHYNIRNHEDVEELKKIGYEFASNTKKYSKHINIITWLIVLYFTLC